MQQVWRDYLRDSSWVTIAWEWFQTFLGRAVEAVLWVTMVFSCYQLIPSAPQVAPGVSTFMFILQFIGLDVGGIGLNKLAQAQGLQKWSFVRVISYILIGITLITVAYAGIERAIKIDASVTNGIEVVLVVARSIMTVLYGQAIHSLKQQTQNMRSLVAELQSTIARITEEVRATKATHGEEVRSMKATHEGTLRSIRAMHDEEKRATVTGYQAQIDQLQDAIQAMRSTYEQGLQSTAMGYESQIDSLEDELRATKEKLTKAMSRKRESTDRAMVVSVDRQPGAYDSPIERDTDYQIAAMGSSQKGDYVAADDGVTLAISNGNGQTVIATGSHRDRIKQAMLLALHEQRDLDYRDIAAVAQVGYSTVKKYAPEIKQELQVANLSTIEK